MASISSFPALLAAVAPEIEIRGQKLGVRWEESQGHVHNGERHFHEPHQGLSFHFSIIQPATAEHEEIKHEFAGRITHGHPAYKSFSPTYRSWVPPQFIRRLQAEGVDREYPEHGVSEIKFANGQGSGHFLHLDHASSTLRPVDTSLWESPYHSWTLDIQGPPTGNVFRADKINTLNGKQIWTRVATDDERVFHPAMRLAESVIDRIAAHGLEAVPSSVKAAPQLKIA